jgi:hypothetical protein
MDGYFYCSLPHGWVTIHVAFFVRREPPAVLVVLKSFIYAQKKI